MSCGAHMYIPTCSISSYLLSTAFGNFRNTNSIFLVYLGNDAILHDNFDQCNDVIDDCLIDD